MSQPLPPPSVRHSAGGPQFSPRRGLRTPTEAHRARDKRSELPAAPPYAIQANSRLTEAHKKTVGRSGTKGAARAAASRRRRPATRFASCGPSAGCDRLPGNASGCYKPAAPEAQNAHLPLQTASAPARHKLRSCTRIAPGLQNQHLSAQAATACAPRPGTVATPRILRDCTVRIRPPIRRNVAFGLISDKNGMKFLEINKICITLTFGRYTHCLFLKKSPMKHLSQPCPVRKLHEERTREAIEDYFAFYNI